MDPCPTAVCQHGSATTDAGQTYDGTKCGCVQCPNFDFCGTWCAPASLKRWNGICEMCFPDVPQLTFVQEPVKTECCVCLDDRTRFVLHPAGCGHKVCLTCFIQLYTTPVKRIVDPCLYGFRMPKRKFRRGSMVARHSSYRRGALAAWKKDQPINYEQWVTDQNVADLDYQTALQLQEQRARTCPLCRSEYTQ